MNFFAFITKTLVIGLICEDIMTSYLLVKLDGSGETKTRDIGKYFCLNI